MFYTAGIALSFFLCLLLIGKKYKTVADHVLFAWLLVVGLHLLLYYLFESRKIYTFPELLGLSLPMPLLHPPLLFLYTFSLSRGQLPKYWFLHLIPASLCYLYLIPFFMQPAAQKAWVFQHYGAGYEGFMTVLVVCLNLSGILYTVWAHRLLQQHRRSIADLYSWQENINLQWLQNIIYGLAIIWLAVLFSSDALVFGCTVLFVLFIGYFGIRQAGVFSNQQVFSTAVSDLYPTKNSPETNALKPEPYFLENLSVSDPPGARDVSPADKKKYEKSGLTDESAQLLHDEMRRLMSMEQVFKDSNLSLSSLAERLQTHPNYLSQIINEKEGKNFYDYVNTLRIEAFLKMASEPDSRRFTLFALALECGFNSKSAFNRFFKKATGQSPSDYLK